MCKTVINRVNQFGQRIQGYEVFESKTGEILGMTEKDIIKAIKAGESIRGLTLDADGKVVLAEMGFFQNNIIEKSTLTAMKAVNGDPVVNVFYTVIGVENGQYNLLNSRFGKMTVSKEKLVTMYELGVVQGGCKIDEKGELVLAEVFNTSAPVVNEGKQDAEPAKSSKVKSGQNNKLKEAETVA